MTRKLSHGLVAGERLQVTVDGVSHTDYTVSEERLSIEARECYVFAAGQHLIVKVNGSKKFDYTVPDGRILLVETEAD